MKSNRAHVLDAGVVDEDVDLGGQVGQRVEVGEVHGDRGDRRTGGQGRETLLVAVDGMHLRARPGQGPRDARSDAAGGPGDEGRPAGQVDGFVDRHGAPFRAVRGVVACVIAGVGHAGRLGRPVEAPCVAT